MKQITLLVSFIALTVSLAGCSRGSVEVVNEKWRCEKQKHKRECEVSFIAKNTSHLPVESIIRIRAHRRSSVLGSDAYQNIVVGDKVINTTLSPGEKRSFTETINVNSRPTNIVVTIVGKEI